MYVTKILLSRPLDHVGRRLRQLDIKVKANGRHPPHSVRVVDGHLNPDEHDANTPFCTGNSNRTDGSPGTVVLLMTAPVQSCQLTIVRVRLGKLVQ